MFLPRISNEEKLKGTNKVLDNCRADSAHLIQKWRGGVGLPVANPDISISFCRLNPIHRSQLTNGSHLIVAICPSGLHLICLMLQAPSAFRGSLASAVLIRLSKLAADGGAN